MSGFNEYAAEALDGMKAGASDIGRSAIADIGDSYQEILMSHASISPADGLTGTMENVTTQVELMPEPEIAAPQPEIDIA